MKQLYKNIYVAGQIAPEDFASLAEAGIRTVINNRPDDEEPGQLTAAAAQDLAAEHDIAYHYLPMANGQAMPPTLVDDFKSVLDGSNDPILAHCRSGMRSSFLWALGQIPEGNVTVDQAIEAAQAAGIPLGNARAALESVQP
ncbi:MAG: hypothetical protein ACI9SX_000242 [Pseudoalteromonas tetraodonis]|jgi:uncharacterized protein (TIGR01244 family)